MLTRVAVLLAAFAVCFISAQRHHDPCRTCTMIVNIARHHFHNNVSDETALKTELLKECTRLGQHEGQQAADHCTQIVNNNIDKIFADLHAGVHAFKTCEDIGECPTPTVAATAAAAGREKLESKAHHDPCRTCNLLMNIARHHFHNNITDEAALKAQLLVECKRLGDHEGQAAGEHCTDLVNNNIDKIFGDLKAGKTPYQTCSDIGDCKQKTVVRARRQAPSRRECRTCEMLVNLALHHFHNNITDVKALQDQLHKECNNLSGMEGAQAAQSCLAIVDKNIDKIYADIQNIPPEGDRKASRQTCIDIGECQK